MLRPNESMTVRCSNASDGQYATLLSIVEAETGPSGSGNIMVEVLAFVDDVA